ncbi:mycobactin polyketide synthase MbtD [Mycolicibacterium brumae]|uniref:Polyketide synthase n=1 Tax=Mycolicibacterium brumae TaxID=85968 RepID=A0A2G5P8U6_9MYCO|nr:mycobactin polyketide synthase MbtD [Mycolicibacterium brumae]PIB74324.1 polyketide synthase [Mycolicibacterium brumae]
MTGPRTLPDGRNPVLLSAHDESLLSADAAALLRFLDRDPRPVDVAATLLRTRRIRRHRVLLRAADTAELADGLRAVVAGVAHPLVARSSSATRPRRAFVFPGQGGQWPGMGADLYAELPVYRDAADRAAAAFTAAGAATPLPYLIAGDQPPEAEQVEIQGAQFLHAIALAASWRAHGVEPDLAVGHSLGEIAAAYLCGAIELPDAVAAVIARAQAVQGFHGGYGMAVLGCSPERAEALIADSSGWLELSVVNSPSSVVVSGDRAAVSELVARVAADGEFVRELAVEFPAHTSLLEPVAAQMINQLPDARFAAPAMPFIGSATGATVSAGAETAAYWANNLRSTVRFDRAAQCAIDHGAAAFIEMSAHPALLTALDQLAEHTAGPSPLLLGSGRRDTAPIDELSAGIAAAALADPEHPWREHLTGAETLLRGFPNAPMKSEHHWLAPRAATPAADITVAAETWTPEDTTVAPAGLRRVAVTGPGADTALADRLRTALDGHHGVRLTPPADAELLLVIAPALDHPDVIRAVEDLVTLVGAAGLDYPNQIGADCREVCLLTVGGQQVGEGEPVPLPAQAALAGMHRTIGFDHNDQTFRCLDLPSWDCDDDTAAAAVEALLSDAVEMAVRPGRTGPQAHRRTLTETAPAPALRLDDGLLDNVVITGGAGAIGMHFARYLAARGARRIVLLSRRGADPAAIAELTERSGAAVVAPPCDITDADAVRSVAAAHAGDGATLLIHAAAVATLGTGGRFTADECADTFGAKVVGGARMAELWPLRPNARMLLCSSVSGVWGGRGHPAYPGANRMLDVLAGQLRAKDKRCASIRWGLWQVEGIADAAEVAQIARSGLRPMPPAAAIEAALHDHPGDPIVMAADAQRLRVFVDTRHAEPAGQPDPTADLDAPAAVRAELSAVLRLADPDDVDLEASLFDLGIDSLLALDLRKRLERATGGRVSLAALLGGMTGAGLIAEVRRAAQQAATPEKVESSRD